MYGRALEWPVGHEAIFPFAGPQKAGFEHLEKEVGLLAGEMVGGGLGSQAF